MPPIYSAVDPNPSPAPCSLLEYLVACQPRLDDSMVTEVLQALKVPEEFAKEVEQEVRLVWENTGRSAEHTTRDQVLRQAHDLAREVAARVVRESAHVGRLPRSEMMDSVRRRACRGIG